MPKGQKPKFPLLNLKHVRKLNRTDIHWFCCTVVHSSLSLPTEKGEVLTILPLRATIIYHVKRFLTKSTGLNCFTQREVLFSTRTSFTVLVIHLIASSVSHLFQNKQTSKLLNSLISLIISGKHIGPFFSGLRALSSWALDFYVSPQTSAFRLLFLFYGIWDL